MSERTSIERIVESFKSQWETGNPPDIQQFLTHSSQENHEQLLEKLLQIDVEFRSKSEQPATPQSYESLGTRAVEMAASILDKTFVSTNDPASTESGSDADSDFESAATLAPSNTPLVKPDEFASLESDDTESRQIGPYKLLQQIGEGGMGTVWMAEQEEPVRRRVALKLIRAEIASKETIARFESERQALAMMDHPNIAKVLDAGTTKSGSPFFVMELVKGISITDFCDEHKLSIEQRLELFLPVCKAIHHAHQKGIIHRDLKPSNLLVTVNGDEAIPKVIDFGLAKALEHTTKLTEKTVFTEYGKVVGTLQYMSPEQATTNALDVDTRTDIYSLGVMLYELLAGSTPLHKDSMRNNALLQVLAMIRETDPPRPSTRLSSTGLFAQDIGDQRKIAATKLQQILKGELDWIVMKALEKDRRRRYDTANDFADDIGRYLNDEAVDARPPSFPYKASKFVRKNKGVVASVTAIAIVMIAATLVSTSFGLIANRAAAKANEARQSAEKQFKIAQQAKLLAEEKTIEAEQQQKLAEANAREVALERDRANSEAKRATFARKRAVEARVETEKVLGKSHLQLANANWKAGRTQEAWQDLARVPREHRKFEWFAARKQFEGSYMTLAGHRDFIRCLALSPNGKILASAGGSINSRDFSIQLWNTRTGEQLSKMKGHVGLITGLSFDSNGSKIYSVSVDGAFKTWDVNGSPIGSKDTGNPIVNFALNKSNDEYFCRVSTAEQNVDAFVGNNFTLSIHSKDADNSVDMGRNGVACCYSADGTLWVWSERKLKSFDEFGVEKNSFDVELLNSGNKDSSQTILVVDKKIFIHDGHLVLAYSTEGTKLFELSDEKFEFSSFTLSPDGKHLAVGGNLGAIKIWNVRRQELVSIFKGHPKEIFGMVFSPDGRILYSAGHFGLIKAWDWGADLQRISEKTKLVVSARESSLNNSVDARKKYKDIHIDPNGDRAVFPTSNKILVYNTMSGELVSSIDRQYDGPITVDTNCKIFATYSRNSKSVSTFSLTTGDKIQEFSLGEYLTKGENVIDIHFGTDETDIVVVSLKKENQSQSSRGKSVVATHPTQKYFIASWELETGTQNWKFEDFEKGRLTSKVSRLTNQIYFCKNYGGSGFSAIDLKDGKDRRIKLDFPLYNSIRSIDFSLDDKYVVCCSMWDMEIWNVDAETKLSHISQYEQGNCVSFSPDSEYVALGGQTSLTIYDWKMGKRVFSEEYNSPIETVKYSSTGEYICVAGKFGIDIIRAPKFSDQRLIASHDSWVMSCGVGPNSATIVSVAWDGEVVVFDHDLQSEINRFSAGGIVNDVSFRSDGKQILLGLKDQFQIWDLDSATRTTSVRVKDFTCVRVAFGPKDRFVHAIDWNGKTLAWDLESNCRVETEHKKIDWTEIDERQSQFGGNGFLPFAGIGRCAVSFDMDYWKRPEVQELRKHKAQPKPDWHRMQAEIAEDEKNHFATTFHRAWVINSEDHTALDIQLLRESIENLKQNSNKDDAEIRNLFTLPVQKAIGLVATESTVSD